jgi:hypothetical protein
VILNLDNAPVAHEISDVGSKMIEVVEELRMASNSAHMNPVLITIEGH